MKFFPYVSSENFIVLGVNLGLSSFWRNFCSTLFLRQSVQLKTKPSCVLLDQAKPSCGSSVLQVLSKGFLRDLCCCFDRLLAFYELMEENLEPHRRQFRAGLPAAVEASGAVLGKEVCSVFWWGRSNGYRCASEQASELGQALPGWIEADPSSVGWRLVCLLTRILPEIKH